MNESDILYYYQRVFDQPPPPSPSPRLFDLPRECYERYEVSPPINPGACCTKETTCTCQSDQVCSDGTMMQINQTQLMPPEETWARRPFPPPWVKAPPRVVIKPSPQAEKCPKVCPRFLLENRNKWNRINQEWDPILNKLLKARMNCYKPSYCPYHRGYDM